MNRFMAFLHKDAPSGGNILDTITHLGHQLKF